MLKDKIFIEKAKLVHGDKYDYSKVEYINNSTKVCIICPIHGEFWQTPNNHLNGRGCKFCKYETLHKKFTKTVDDFIKKAKQVHGDKYDYSKVNYINAHTKVCIICPIHGEFWQTPHSHLNGSGCLECSKEKKSKDKIVSYDKVIEKFKKIHGNKYIYLNEYESKYIDAKHKIKVICPQHGEFWITPNSHLNGVQCAKCSKKYHYSNKEIINKIQNIHGDKYDYSKVEYKNIKTKVCIICPIHGEFWMMPDMLINQKQGCPKCKSSKLESEIRLFLQKNNISFEEQKKFGWLGLQSLDFYLPQHNIAIECQGIQHFIKKDFFGGESGFNNSQKRDNKKRELCENNNIRLLYYSDLGINYPYQVFENKEELLKEIISHKSD